MRHWSERLACSLCGKTFRSYAAEARHRHNAPVLCKRVSPGGGKQGKTKENDGVKPRVHDGRAAE